MAKGKRKIYLWIIIVLGLLCLLFVIGVFVLTMPSPTLDKRIAEFEARRKIPDAENAAVIYDKLFKDANFTAIFVDSNFIKMSDSIEYSKPWMSKDYPETAEWIKNQQKFINELLKASKFEKCYFPIPTNTEEDSSHFDKLRMLRNIAQLMVYTANNDIGEGRINDAIEKYRFTIKLAEHIYQQPLFIDYMFGWVVELSAVDCLNELILKTEISEEQLKAIESIHIQIADTWQQHSQQKSEGERLWADKVNNKHIISFDYISAIFTRQHTLKDSLKDRYKSYLRLLAKKRANRILIGLRKYKNQNGQWPDNLEQIKSLVEPIVLIDPQNSGSFVYKKTDDGFTLYSKGPNNIDEGGKSDEPADDYMIWPKM